MKMKSVMMMLDIDILAFFSVSVSVSVINLTDENGEIAASDIVHTVFSSQEDKNNVFAANILFRMFNRMSSSCLLV